MTADDKLALLGGYGVESSKDLSNEELTQICDYLNDIINPEDAKRDKMRKRVIAAIGGWLRLIGKGNEGVAYIKSVACRAAKVENFNHISLDRLTTIYNMFLKRQKDAKNVNEVAGAIAYEARFGTDNLPLN
ncbi:MAG: regulatory protein GemA [Muribaculaceae bacterium]|nr:regulatory protein GemA [Muribaculaceae bacterium]